MSYIIHIHLFWCSKLSNNVDTFDEYMTKGPEIKLKIEIAGNFSTIKCGRNKSNVFFQDSQH